MKVADVIKQLSAMDPELGVCIIVREDDGNDSYGRCVEVVERAGMVCVIGI